MRRLTFAFRCGQELARKAVRQALHGKKVLMFIEPDDELRLRCVVVQGLAKV